MSFKDKKLVCILIKGLIILLVFILVDLNTNSHVCFFIYTIDLADC